MLKNIYKKVTDETLWGRVCACDKKAVEEREARKRDNVYVRNDI